MGMSATQARFLCLTARKNNVEFEGQQINQQRTTLSNESSSYYSELCNMEVPTPPSVDDYTKVAYTFNDGAMTNTIVSLLPQRDASGVPTGKYSISYIEQWQDDYAIVAAASSLVQQNGTPNAPIYNIGNSQLRALGVAPAAGIDEYYDSLNDEQKAKLIATEKDYYEAMLQDRTGDTGGFMVRYVQNSTTGNHEPFFYANSELSNQSKYNNKNLASISCYSLGSTTRTQEVLNQIGTIEKDASGRYIAITLETEVNGVVVSNTYNLTTTTTTDEDAYNDAMNEYKYRQHEYDHKVQEINSKLEIVQQQDKQLELKLKQLDTEENAIQTEMDAVKKVISKNVEGSFKTFNA